MELFIPNRSLVVPLDFSACTIMLDPQDSSSGKVIAAKPEQLNLILEPLWQDTHTHTYYTLNVTKNMVGRIWEELKEGKKHNQNILYKKKFCQ